MSWIDCELGDVVTLKRGHDLPKDSRTEGQVPVVSSSGITGWHNEIKAEPPGVVTGRYGTIGEVFYLDRPYWPLNTALYAIDFHGNDPRFVAYFLRSQLKNYKSEKAAVPGVDRNVLHKIKVRCPDPQTQSKIVSVLSVYDDLIENNRRRIALLEQAARLLYREWFVHFRFPGYETAKFVDGLPEGWEECSFADMAEYLNGFAFKPYHLGKHGLPIVKIPELKNGILDKTPYYEGREVPDKYLLTDGNLIFSWSGTLAIDFWNAGNAYLNQHLFKVTPKDGFSEALILTAVRESMPKFMGKAVGATMKHIRRSALDEVKHPLPPSQLLKEFNDLIIKKYDQVQLLRKQNAHLTKSRDLLLPRLMDGRIPVNV